MSFRSLFTKGFALAQSGACTRHSQRASSLAKQAMSSFRFIYEGGDFEDEGNSPFPSKTTIESYHEFADDQTWLPNLWQFC